MFHKFFKRDLKISVTIWQLYNFFCNTFVFHLIEFYCKENPKREKRTASVTEKEKTNTFFVRFFIVPL